MKRKISRMWQSGIAFLMALCLMIGLCPSVAFADETEKQTINYVSIGDSMANGYCFNGYAQGSGDVNHEYYDFAEGSYVYGDGAYPLQFEAWLEKQGYDVKHTKLAPSALLAEDLLYLLGGSEKPENDWNGYEDYVGDLSDNDLKDLFLDAVTTADVITMGIGNASFGAYMLALVTDAIGIMGSEQSEVKVNLELAMAALDETEKEVVLNLYNKMMEQFENYIPAELAEKYNVKGVCDVVAYTAASFFLNYKGSLERIIELNPDVEIILVGLMNTTYGMTVSVEGIDSIPIGDIMDNVFGSLNAYIAGLPTVMQAVGEWENAKFYYAEQPNPLFISQEFDDLKDANWGNIQDGRLSGTTVRMRNIQAFKDSLGDVLGMAISEKPLKKIFLEDVQLYEEIHCSENVESAWGLMYSKYGAEVGDYEMAIAIYLGIEDAVAASTDVEEIPLSALQNIASVEGLMSVFQGMDMEAAAISPEATREVLGTHLTKGDVKPAMCKIYALFKVGNGMSVHPTPEGHDNIAKAVIDAYESKYTVQDETLANVEIVLNELYNLLETYGPEVAAQVWAQWEDYGYVEAVETSINELNTLLTERYTYYTETALPAIEKAVNELSAQKDELTVELEALKVQLAEKKAELANVIAQQEIGSVTAPDINIDVIIGDNQQTEVPGYDCNVEGEGIQAELEAAVKDLEHAIAVIEALVNDIEADIADMAELAAQIAEAVAALEKTMMEVAADADDMQVAFEAIVEVMTNASSDKLVDTVVSTFEEARDVALAAAEVLKLTMGTASDMMDDIDAMTDKLVADGEALYNKFVTELPGCIEQIPEEGLMLIGGSVLAIQQGVEEAKAKIEAELPGKIAELEAEYADDIAAAEAKLAELNTKIQAEIDAKYGEIAAQIETEYQEQIVALEEKKAELEAELNGYMAELEALAEDVADEVRQQVQAQIDRVTGDLAVVNEDLACAVSHLDTALQMAYDEIVAEVEKAYEEAVAELEKAIADLKAELEKAIEDLKAAADKSIQDLIDEANKKIEELDVIGDELSKALTSILESIRKELEDAQKAIEDILSGSLDSVEDMKAALVVLGADALAELVDLLAEQIYAWLEAATTADLVIDDDFTYVAIGDGSAETESYVEKLAAALNAEAAKNGVDEIEVVNNAFVGNTVTAERENLTDVSEADLITIGFSNVEFLDRAIDGVMSGAKLDWAAVVGEENVQYVDQALAEVAAKIAESGIEGDYAVIVNGVVEAYAYAAMQYATVLPELINEIHAVNPEALVIIVGMYNPMEGVTIALDENAALDLGEYIDYLVDGVAVHGIAYSILSGNSIYVDAPSVSTINTDTELGIMDLMKLINNNFASLYPDAAGDDYIAAEIADALNITYVKSEGLLGDADGNGTVNTTDAKLIMQYYAGLIAAEQLDLSVCDVDGNDTVNTTDAKLVMQYYAQLIAKFPVEG